MKKIRLFKITSCAILSAFATVSFIIESLFPPLFLPGARMGISNIFILLCIFFAGGRYAFIAITVKTCLGSLLIGNPFAIVYSLPAGIIALSIQLVLIYIAKNVSIVCTSVCGAVINIITQNLTFCVITNTTAYLTYSPYLALTGVLGGLVVGFAVYMIIKILPKSYLSKIKTGEKF